MKTANTTLDVGTAINDVTGEIACFVGIGDEKVILQIGKLETLMHSLKQIHAEIRQGNQVQALGTLQ